MLAKLAVGIPGPQTSIPRPWLAIRPQVSRVLSLVSSKSIQPIELASPADDETVCTSLAQARLVSYLGSSGKSWDAGIDSTGPIGGAGGGGLGQLDCGVSNSAIECLCLRTLSYRVLNLATEFVISRDSIAEFFEKW